jgi:quinoprotein glucose dehydrogenase
MRNLLFTVIGLVHITAAAGEWNHYGGDAGGTRFTNAVEITLANIGDLQLAWQFRTGDAASGEDYFGRDSSFKATPILFANRLIFSTGFNRVFAVDPENGDKLWVFDPQVDFSRNYAEMFTSRGVSAWQDDEVSEDRACAQRIYLGTLDARLIAIDATDGKKCTTFGQRGEIDLSAGIRNYRRGQYSLTSPVTVVNDVLVVGSSIGDNGGVELEPGVVRGFDARSGRQLWQWDPVPRAATAPGGDTWSNNGGKRNGAANVWSVISADPERNLVFLPTTSPSPDFYGGERLGDNLYASSIVALHAGSGDKIWHFQTVHHDLWDYDNAAQPLLVDIHQDGKDIPVVVQATKMGHVFVLHRETGRPVFPVFERDVPQTDIPGERTSQTQPFPASPPPLHDSKLKIWEFSAEHKAYCTDMLADVRFDGIFTPPSLRGSLLYPGNGGGTNWGSMAADTNRQVAILAVSRLPTIVKLVPRSQFRDTAEREGGGDLDVQFTAQSGTHYGMARHEVYNPQLMLPCLEGPWGELIAINLGDGSVRWRAPLGMFPGVENHPQASLWGTLASGGPLMTASGIVFIADRYRRMLLAYVPAAGAWVWGADRPADAAATPMSYTADGRQFVVITAGGKSASGDLPGDYVVAFALQK